jgi:hypothetical protein
VAKGIGIRKAAKIAFVIAIEVVLLVFAGSPVLIHDRSEVAAFFQYYKAPTERNRQLWMTERLAIEREKLMYKTAGWSVFAAFNIALFWKMSRRKRVAEALER